MPKTSSLIDQQPHSVEAERTVLGALLLDPDAILKTVDRLQASDFYDPTYRTVYDAITRLHEQGCSATIGSSV